MLFSLLLILAVTVPVFLVIFCKTTDNPLTAKLSSAAPEELDELLRQVTQELWNHVCVMVQGDVQRMKAQLSLAVGQRGAVELELHAHTTPERLKMGAIGKAPVP